MTNAERFIGDEDLIDQFTYELSNYMFDNLGWYEGNVQTLKKTIECFFKSNIKPQLTEDERVILKYVDGEYTHIQRADGLWLIHYEDEYTVHQLSFEMYSHLFQFIKERRRI